MEEIVRKVERLFDTEQQYLKLIKSSDSGDAKKIIELITRAVSLMNEIKLALTEHDPDSLEIENDNLRNTLRKVREGERIESVEAYETLREYLKSKSINEDASELETSDFVENYWNDLFDIYHSRFDINSYFYGKLEVGPIITSSSLPPALKDYFSELREAYAYGLYKACIALCKMILEIGFADCLSKIKEYNNASELNKIAKNKPNFEFGLFENINIASSLKIIPEDLAKKADDVRLIGNKIVHFKATNSKEKLRNTFEVIKDTITIIEALYH